MVLFGGSNGDKIFNDLYIFNLSLLRWIKIDAEGEAPTPREGHIAKMIGNDKMFVHGGFNDEHSFNDCYILAGLSKLEIT